MYTIQSHHHQWSMRVTSQISPHFKACFHAIKDSNHNRNMMESIIWNQSQCAMLHYLILLYWALRHRRPSVNPLRESYEHIWSNECWSRMLQNVDKFILTTESTLFLCLYLKIKIKRSVSICKTPLSLATCEYSLYHLTDLFSQSPVSQWLSLKLNTMRAQLADFESWFLCHSFETSLQKKNYLYLSLRRSK